MASQPPLPSPDSLRLCPLDPSRLHFCKCPTFCAAWAAHPLGNPLRALFYDAHRVQEVVRLEPRYRGGYDPYVAHRGWPSPTRLLREYAHAQLPAPRPGHILQAQGAQACELGAGCWISWDEVAVVSGSGVTCRGRCARHRDARGKCLTRDQAGSPFGPLFDWQPGRPMLDWNSRFKWVTERQLPETLEPAPSTSQSATPPTTPPRNPSPEPDQEAGTPPPPSIARVPAESRAACGPETDDESEVSVTRTLIRTAPCSSSSSPAPAPAPAKRIRLSEDRQRQLDAVQQTYNALRETLEAEEVAEEAERLRLQREQEESRRRQQAEAHEWLGTVTLVLGQASELDDHVAGQGMLENWILEQAAHIRDRREQTRARDRSQGVGPMQVEEEEEKGAILGGANEDLAA